MTVAVPLSNGTVEVSTAWTRPAGDPWAGVVLAHGAGAGMDHPFLVGVADALAAEGVAVLRFTFPYLQAGRRMPGPAAHAVTAWDAVFAAAASELPGVPLVAAGKSYGGRMASMAVAEGRIDPAGLVYLGYPLHPPGRPEKARSAHLPQIACPQLFLAGTKDPFLQPLDQFTDVVATCRDAEIVWTDGGDHSFAVAGRRLPPEEVGAGLVPPITTWLRGLAQRPAA